jgi:hypothetical protein
MPAVAIDLHNNVIVVFLCLPESKLNGATYANVEGKIQ